MRESTATLAGRCSNDDLKISQGFSLTSDAVESLDGPAVGPNPLPLGEGFFGSDLFLLDRFSHRVAVRETERLPVEDLA